jgi:hypothetical protein
MMSKMEGSIKVIGRPRERDIQSTVRTAKQLFAQGLTQIEVCHRLGWKRLNTMRKYLSVNNISMKELQGDQNQ